jgi:pilus assembly protein CpaB
MMLRLALFFVMALGLAGFGTVAWLGTRPPPSATAAAQNDPPPFRSVVLATSHTLRSGALIRPDDLAPIELPPNDIPRGARRDTPASRSEILGSMVRHALGAGEVVLPEDIVRPGDHGFLAAVLAPGQRAVAIGVDAVSGTAGLIWPGDRVDVILTQSLQDTSLPAGKRVSGETILRDVRVIAIDQDLAQGATPGTVPGQNNGGSVPSSRTITIEVNPQGAERVAVATRLGRLSLSVIAADVAPSDGAGKETAANPNAGAGKEAGAPNAAADHAANDAHLPAITWGGDVSPALQGGPTKGKDSTIRVFLGKDDSKDFHF